MFSNHYFIKSFVRWQKKMKKKIAHNDWRLGEEAETDANLEHEC
jgi:hypothetical protein